MPKPTGRTPTTPKPAAPTPPAPPTPATIASARPTPPAVTLPPPELFRGELKIEVVRLDGPQLRFDGFKWHGSDFALDRFIDVGAVRPVRPTDVLVFRSPEGARVAFDAAKAGKGEWAAVRASFPANVVWWDKA